MNKTVIILRGVSGSGKTTLAEYLLSDKEYICSADDYFNQNGEYKFDATKLFHAHNYCKSKFLNLIKQSTGLIIVCNTNTRESEMQYYQDEAKKYNYQVFSLIVENRHGGINVHNVPKESLEKQKNNLYNNIKLI